MFKINLVPEVQQQKQKTAHRNTISTIVAIAILGVCVVTLFVIGAIKVAKNIELNKTNESINTVRAESEQYRELEETVLSLEKGLAGIKQIMAGENAWTKLLPHLEAATPNDVRFTRISVEGNTIDADLKGRSVNSLARIIESYKDYQVIVLSGVTTSGENVSISLDNGSETVLNASEDGVWSVALNFDANSNHTVTVLANGSETKISYDTATKSLTSSEGSITAEVKNLFSSIETTQYSKEGNTVSFNLSFNFDSEAIW